MERLKPIDTLRGIAALIVMISHMLAVMLRADLFPAAISPHIYAHAKFGVDLFFVLSGFCLSLLLLRLNSYFSFVQYILRRILRIYPSHIFVLLLYFIALNLGVSFNNINTSPQDWLINIFLLFNIFPTDKINPVTWSLFYELIFYILLPVSLASIRNGKILRPYIFYTAFIFFALISGYKFLTLDGYYFSFLHGVLIAYLFTNKKKLSLPSLVIAAPILLAAYILAYLGIPTVEDRLWIGVINGIIAAVIVLYFIERNYSFAILNYVGRFSYSLYLIHFPVIVACTRFAVRIPWIKEYLSQSWFYTFIFIAAIFAACIVAAMLLYKFIEAPFHRLAQRIQLNLNPAVAGFRQPRKSSSNPFLGQKMPENSSAAASPFG